MFVNFTKEGQKSLLDDKVTAAVTQAVLHLLLEETDAVDYEAVLRGMSSAVVTFAYTLQAPDVARNILITMAAALSDPVTREWALSSPAKN